MTALQKCINAELIAHHRSKPSDVHIYVSETDMTDVYGLLIGPKDSPFAGGQYIAKLKLPTTYPDSAPELTILTPNGRYNVGEELCFSFTARFNRSVMHAKHDVRWSPVWTIETIFRAFLSAIECPPPLTDGPVIGLLSNTNAEIAAFAARSKAYNTSNFDFIDGFDIVPDVVDEALREDRKMTEPTIFEPKLDENGDVEYEYDE